MGASLNCCNCTEYAEIENDSNSLIAASRTNRRSCAVVAPEKQSMHHAPDFEDDVLSRAEKSICSPGRTFCVCW